MNNSTANREIISKRTFNVPRERLWDAFSDPKRLALWWGPEGFTNKFQEFDFKPGGFWRFMMYAPNGAEFENESRFSEIVKPERIVFEHLRTIHWFEMTITFVELSGKTTLTWRQLFDSVSEYEKIKNFVKLANEQNFDRLEALVLSS